MTGHTQRRKQCWIERKARKNADNNSRGEHGANGNGASKILQCNSRNWIIYELSHDVVHLERYNVNFSITVLPRAVRLCSNVSATNI